MSTLITPFSPACIVVILSRVLLIKAGPRFVDFHFLHSVGGLDRLLKRYG